MKYAALTLLLAAALASAQTGTFTANGYGGCQNSDPLSKPLYCSVQLSQNGAVQGYLTFFLEQNDATTISAGEVWRFDATDTQTGYATDVTGTIDTTNYMVHFTFSDHVALSGSADLGYTILPGHCSRTRYCVPPRVVITTGIVGVN
jgi:hypothetical protein